MRFSPCGIFAALALLTGCSQTEVRLYEQNGHLQIDPTSMHGADYVIGMRDIIDIGFGFNANDRVQRNEMALRALKAQCPAGQIVAEDKIELGGSGGLIPLGGPQRRYLIYVKCR